MKLFLVSSNNFFFRFYILQKSQISYSNRCVNYLSSTTDTMNTANTCMTRHKCIIHPTAKIEFHE